jgi:hypothetical protein
MTREERNHQRRREQILQAKRRYRQRQRERKQDPVTPPPAPGPQKDPVWGDEPATVATPAQPPAHEPTPPPEPEEHAPVPKEFPYVRRAARLRVPKGEQGPQRGGESARSWERPEDRNPIDPLAPVGDLPWGDW